MRHADDSQLKSLGVARYGASKPDGKRGPGCDWIHSPTEPIEHYSVGINTRGGVELVFGQPQFEVTTVAGSARCRPRPLRRGDRTAS